ncbi:MAG TPA: glutamate-cysteine ligase family protein [Acidimicrobiales bacterium]|nr:glutamate-cysteine ligase family protein [Acidimicrobiales bacterium]
MPARQPQLTPAAVAAFVADRVFGAAADPHGLGVELEWLTSHGARDRRLPATEATALIDGLSPLPAGSRLTLEPGGQLEISSAPFRSIDEVCDATTADLAVVDRACEAQDVELIALGADPIRPPERVTRAARYRAMEHYFDQLGRAGRTMMCNTAAIQVNVGLGRSHQVSARWRLANELGPTLIACFANSPFEGGLPSGWKSSRLRAWWALDPTRSRPVPCDVDPVSAWVAYALDARVMFVHLDDERCLPVREPMSFGDWLDRGHDLGYPTEEDLRYHLTTLFPPVRPRGWLELRMFDTLPSPLWQVALAVAGSLLTDIEAMPEVRDAVSGTTDLWVDAAQLGLAHPSLARAGIAVFDLALDGLHRARVSPERIELVERYADRWVRRARCPSDDRLDAWRATGELFPSNESVDALAAPLTAPLTAPEAAR